MNLGYFLGGILDCFNCWGLGFNFVFGFVGLNWFGFEFSLQCSKVFTFSFWLISAVFLMILLVWGKNVIKLYFIV